MSRVANGGLQYEGKPLRVELLGACQSEFIELPRALNSCALNVAKSGYQVRPGVVHPNVLAIHVPEIQLKHLLLVPPFLWASKPPLREFDDIVVDWLLAVPISDSEVEFARRYDSESPPAGLRRAPDRHVRHQPAAGRLSIARLSARGRTTASSARPADR